MRIKGNELFRDEVLLERLGGPIVSWILALAVLLWTFTTNKIYFDRDNMYIKRFRKDIETVPLQKILRINRRFPIFENQSMARYAFHYKGTEGLEKKIRFYYRYKYFSKGALKECILLIKMKNPGFTEKHRTHSFDLADH
jgi:hypothetical protein